MRAPNQVVASQALETLMQRDLAAWLAAKAAIAKAKGSPAASAGNVIPFPLQRRRGGSRP